MSAVYQVFTKSPICAEQLSYSDVQAGTALKAFSMVMLTIVYGDGIHVTKWLCRIVFRGSQLFEGIVSSHHAVLSRPSYDYGLNGSLYI